MTTRLKILKAYQAWRTGKDERTLDEAGLSPAEISAALDWAIEQLDTPAWVQTGDNTLHGAIDHWQNEAAKLSGDLQYWHKEAERRLEENNALRAQIETQPSNLTIDAMAEQISELTAELEATERLAIKQGRWLQDIVNITKGEPGELERHSTHDVVESVEALRVERDEALARCERLEYHLGYASRCLRDTRFNESKPHLEVRAMLRETPSQSLAHIKVAGATCKDYLQVRGINPESLWERLKHGDEDHRKWLKDALVACFDNEPVPPPYPPSPGVGKLKAQGALEALQRAMAQQGFSREYVAVNSVQAAIEQMEKDNG